MKFDEEYQRLQEEFYLCVETYDPSSFQDLLQIHPYHVDSLLQLSEFCKKTGELQMAGDFLERSIYAFEATWHKNFDVTSNSCRLDYSVEENKPFFLALFRYVQMLGSEGTSRTALEYCKLLLHLDSTDPLFISLIIDYYSLRSSQYEFLLEFYQEALKQKLDEEEEKISETSTIVKSNADLEFLPNMCFSVAYAKFKLEQREIETKEKSPFSDISATTLIQRALMLFPHVITPLCKKNSITMKEMAGDFTFYDQTHYTTPSLQHLVSLYVERNHALWRDPQVLKWLKDNAKIVAQKNAEKDESLRHAQAQIKVQFKEGDKNTFTHLLLSEYAGVVDALPPEIQQVMRGGGGLLNGPLLYNGFQQHRANGTHQQRNARFVHGNQQGMEQGQQQVVHAPTSNPLALFLQTLMPWQPTPNAPPVQQQGTDGNATPEWINNLVSAFNAMRNGNGNQNESQQQ